MFALLSYLREVLSYPPTYLLTLLNPSFSLVFRVISRLSLLRANEEALSSCVADDTFYCNSGPWLVTTLGPFRALGLHDSISITAATCANLAPRAREGPPITTASPK